MTTLRVSQLNLIRAVYKAINVPSDAMKLDTHIVRFRRACKAGGLAFDEDNEELKALLIRLRKRGDLPRLRGGHGPSPGWKTKRKVKENT